MRGHINSPSIATPEAQVLVEQAQAALMSRHVETARNLLTRALEIEPAHAMALTKLAEVALVGKDYVLAHRHLSTVLRDEPHFAPAWAEMALALWLSGRRLEAVAAGRRAVEIQPHNARARLRLVQFAAWTGRIREATEALAPLLNQATSDPQVYATAIGMMGEIHVAAGRFRRGDSVFGGRA